MDAHDRETGERDTHAGHAGDHARTWAVPDVPPLMVAGAGGVRVAAYEWGNADGREILLVHGVAQCHLCFAPQIASELARNSASSPWTCAATGRRTSRRMRPRTSISSAWADDIAAVLKARACGARSRWGGRWAAASCGST